MRTEVLLYLIEVDSEQSISKAAANLFISKSALSESISTLEQELNVAIFERKKKGLTTTEVGKQIINQAKSVLNEVDKLYHIGDLAPSPINTDYEDEIHFGLNSKFSKTGLNSRLSILMNKYPKLTLHSKFLNYSGCVKQLANHTIDFAITAYSDSLHPTVSKLCSENNITRVTLHSDPIVCLVNRHSLLAQKGSLSATEVVNHTLISYTDVVPDSSYLPNQKLILLSDLTNVINLIKDDIGITLLPYSMYKSSPWILDVPEIALLPVKDTFQYNCILYSNDVFLTSTQKYFIDLYKRTFEKIFI